MLYQMSWSLGHNSLLRLLLALQTITNTAHFDQLPLFFFFFEDRIKASSHTKENWMSVKCLQIPWKHHFTVVCRRANFFLCNKLFQVLVSYMTTFYLLTIPRFSNLGSAQLRWSKHALYGFGWAHSDICCQLDIEKSHLYAWWWHGYQQG